AKDEFVELDADGNPVAKPAARERDDRRNKPAPRKPAAKKAAPRKPAPKKADAEGAAE
ncbi:MAG: 30S ribosomal protein S2, partial [Proteobacteria bacterium]|nr:30S ribosomal protein S2 [Pseudomonadota bacterium]